MDEAVPLVVVLFEDSYFAQLESLMRKLRRDATGPPQLAIECLSVDGYGNFGRRAGDTLRRRWPRSGLVPRCVIAVADGDRAEELAPGVSPPPSHPSQQAAWLISVEQKWHSKLVTNGGVSSADAARLHVVVLRWSRESLIIACPDVLLEIAREKDLQQKLEKFLSTCKPQDPRTAPDESFLGYAKPQQCLNRAFDAIGRPFKKGRDGDDLLKLIADDPNRRRSVSRRVPEIATLVSILNQCALSGASVNNDGSAGAKPEEPVP